MMGGSKVVVFYAGRTTDAPFSNIPHVRFSSEGSIGTGCSNSLCRIYRIAVMSTVTKTWGPLIQKLRKPVDANAAHAPPRDAGSCEFFNLR
jgi:hypothetical protein